MALDFLKSSISDYKDKKTDLHNQRDDLAVNIEKADELVLGAENVDSDITQYLKQVRSSFDAHERELEDLSYYLEQEKTDLQNGIKSEQIKIDTARKKVEDLSGKRYTGGLDAVSKKCDVMMAELESMLNDLDENTELSGASDVIGTRSNIVKIDDDYYRTDDNGNAHMKRGPDKEYHVLPNTKYVINGYTYQTDENGRIIHVEGNLKVKDGDRASLNVKVTDLGKYDQRGHIIADIFGGSNQNDNIVPQLQKINQGAYKVLEMHMYSLLNEGNTLYGDYSIEYSDSSKRPSAITVNYSIGDGESVNQIDVFTKLGITDTVGYSELESNLRNIREQGHSVDCNYSVVFSNDRNNCWVFMEYSVDGGFPTLVQFT